MNGVGLIKDRGCMNYNIKVRQFGSDGVSKKVQQLCVKHGRSRIDCGFML
jgi:hypothetical protein